MKRICILLCLLAAGTAGARIGPRYQMHLGNPSGATANAPDPQHYLVIRPQEALDYSSDLGEPNWASWSLTVSDMGSAPRTPTFQTDTNLPAGLARITSADYEGVGYDRGHLCPSADRTASATDNRAVFWMSNIVPQEHALNAGPWEQLETFCRILAKRQELYIVAGPGGFAGKKIAKKITVPGFTWKIVACATGLITAVEMPQSARGAWTNYITTVPRIERDTGYQFSIPKGRP